MADAPSSLHLSSTLRLNSFNFFEGENKLLGEERHQNSHLRKNDDHRRAEQLSTHSSDATGRRSCGCGDGLLICPGRAGPGVQGRERSKGERETGDDFEARQDRFQIHNGIMESVVCQMIYVSMSVLVVLLPDKIIMSQSKIH